MAYENGDHRPPSNWKEDARLAWKLVGFLFTIVALSITIAGWGFKAWADNLREWTVATQEAVRESNEATKTAISTTQNMIRDHINYSNFKVLEYERRLTTLEADNHRHRQDGQIENLPESRIELFESQQSRRQREGGN